MAINVASPDDRRADLVAALKTLMQPEWGDFEAKAQAVVDAFAAATNEGPLIVTDATWAPTEAVRWREVWFAGACAVTFPNDLDLPLGFSVSMRPVSAGAVTLGVGAGAAQFPAASRMSTRYLSATATVVAKTSTAVTWAIEGAVL